MEIEELISKLKEISSLSELEITHNINSNDLIYAIICSEKYELLKDYNMKLDINDSESFEDLIDYLLKNSDVLYTIQINGFSFSEEELDIIFNTIFNKYQYSTELSYFFQDFFKNKDELNSFINNHRSFFEKYIDYNSSYIPSVLNDCDNFVELILQKNKTNLIGNLENYSSSNLKLLAKLLNRGEKLPYYLGNDRFAQHIFDVKDVLDSNEFSALLDLLKDESRYSRKLKNQQITTFEVLIKENFDYLIEVVSQTKTMPKCLAVSNVFRDECIKRNRIDLATKCIFPPDILQNDSLIDAYCSQLGVSKNNFIERTKWLLNYYQKNNNIFNTFLSASLKDNIFNLNKDHYERFINDIEIQLSISKLSDKELQVLSKISEVYNYKDYDISNMIVNIINNINDYEELINSLDIINISEQDLRKLVSIMQLPNNNYLINDTSTLKDYSVIKKQFFEDNFYLNNIDFNKDTLLKALFNIDLKEAQYINSKYCLDKHDNNILNNLKHSELPVGIYNYLALINKIVCCDNNDYLFILYNELKENNIYDSEIPLETYLKSEYTKLYSETLYKIDEKNQVYGPKDNIVNETDYNGKKVKVCIPRGFCHFFCGI